MDEKKIANAFNDQNNIFGNNSRKVHIDAKYLPDTKLHKIEVQKADDDKTTIGLAFISEAVKKEIENTPCKDLPDIYHGLFVNLLHALKSSMQEIQSTQTASNAGTSHKYVVRTNDGR